MHSTGDASRAVTAAAGDSSPAALPPSFEDRDADGARCSCGAQANPAFPQHCTRGHMLPGNTVALKDGRYAARTRRIRDEAKHKFLEAWQRDADQAPRDLYVEQLANIAGDLAALEDYERQRPSPRNAMRQIKVKTREQLDTYAQRLGRKAPTAEPESPLDYVTRVQTSALPESDDE